MSRLNTSMDSVIGPRVKDDGVKDPLFLIAFLETLQCYIMLVYLSYCSIIQPYTSTNNAIRFSTILLLQKYKVVHTEYGHLGVQMKLIVGLSTYKNCLA